MRALFVTRSIPLHSGSGGMERVSWDLARALSRDSEVLVLTTSVPGMPDSFSYDGVSVQTIPRTRAGKYSPRWWARTALFRAAKAYDVVMSVSAAATAMINFQRGPSYIFQAHGTALRELKSNLRVRSHLWALKSLRYLFWMALDSFTYHRVDTVIAASEQVAGSLRSWPYGSAWKRTELRVIPNATDTEFFQFNLQTRAAARKKMNVSDDQTLVLSISRLDRQKGVDRILMALTTSSKNVTYAIGGSGPTETALRAEVLTMGISEKVSFLGELDRNAVLAALCAADIFVLPVRNFEREALPLSVLEALSVGLRVIVPMGSQWPADLVPLLDFVDVADPVALGAGLDRASSDSREDLLRGRYSLDEWASDYLRRR